MFVADVRRSLLCMTLFWIGCTSVAGLEPLKFDLPGGDAGGGAGAGGAGAAGAAGGSGGTGMGGDPGTGGEATGGSTTTPTCDQQYGAANSYEACDNDDMSCTFYVVNQFESCAEICEGFGGLCLEAFDNMQGTMCTIDSLEACGSVLDDSICRCTRAQ